MNEMSKEEKQKQDFSKSFDASEEIKQLINNTREKYRAITEYTNEVNIRKVLIDLSELRDEISSILRKGDVK